MTPGHTVLVIGGGCEPPRRRNLDPVVDRALAIGDAYSPRIPCHSRPGAGTEGDPNREPRPDLLDRSPRLHSSRAASRRRYRRRARRRRLEPALPACLPGPGARPHHPDVSLPPARGPDHDVRRHSRHTTTINCKGRRWLPDSSKSPSGKPGAVQLRLQTTTLRPLHHPQMDYVPVKTRVGNQLYMFAGILAHNLTRELQIQLDPRARGTTAKRAALWCFREIGTLRRTLIQCAGRMIRPAGKLILSMNSNDRRERELRHALAILNAAA